MVELSQRVASSVQSKLDSLPPLSSECCIYHVTDNLRKVSEDAYRPLLVSIGPYYYGDSKLAPMIAQKLRYVHSFLARNRAYGLPHYIEVITRWEHNTRQCYVTTVGLSSDVFIEMVLVDALFIIELFLRGENYDLIDKDDRIFSKPRMIVEVTRDLGVEENQLPFFVLKGLYDLVFGSSLRHPSFIDLTYRFLMGKKGNAPQRIANADVQHFVDFLRLCYLPSKLRQHQLITNTNLKLEFSPSVSQLSEAGVKFVAGKSEYLLDIGFSNGVLEIPKLVVTDNTESLFRNIIVFEQCHYYFDSYIIDYFAFLAGLINTTKDVEMLIQSGIIENWLGSEDEVTRLFNNIFKQTRLRDSNFYYSSLCRALNAFANTSWHKWKAILKHDYFHHPWAIISVIYAFVMLVLTVLQTVGGFTSK